MKELLKHKLLFVTGKGGVGKSAVSLALAKAAARQGKKTLHISASQQPFVARLYEKAKPIGYSYEVLEKNLSACTLDWKESLHEYIIRQVRFEFLYRYVFDNRVINYFLEATPGLEDLLFLGKIADTVEGNSKKHFSCVVVDMPATGHGLNMLKVPQIVESMVPSGPLHRHATRMRAMIGDQVRTGICVVTLAEEMAVNEAVELTTHFRDDLDLHTKAVIFNAVYPENYRQDELQTINHGSPLLRTLYDCAGSEMRRARRQQLQIGRLKETLLEKEPETEVGVLPFVFDRKFSLASINSLSAALDEQVN